MGSKKHKQGKYPIRQVIMTRDSRLTQTFYNATDGQAPLPAHQISTGTIQHPVTGYYHIWLSTNGLDVTCLATYRDPARADHALQEFKAFLRTPDVYNTDKCAAIFDKLQQAGGDEPRPLPDDLVRQIGRAILSRVVDGAGAE